MKPAVDTPSVASVDEPRIQFVDRLTPRQAVLLHYFWSTVADALCGDWTAFAQKLAWTDAYLIEMKIVARPQVDLMVARISGLPHQVTPEEMQGLSVTLADALDTQVKCIRCGCSDERACEGGCAWISRHPPICSRCA